MAVPGESGLVPGPRPLLTAHRASLRLPPDLIGVLVAVGQACNDVALAVLDAHTQLARSADVLWRLADYTDRHSALEWVADEQYAACRDHAERLTAVYARIAVQYAAYTVQTASRIADGEPPAMPQPMPVTPSDVLRLAQLHAPLLQIPEDAMDGPRQRRLQRTNADLQASHHRLQAAIAAVESPATVFDQPDHVAHTQTAELLEAEFPAALHDYATTCTFAIAAMTSPEP